MRGLGRMFRPYCLWYLRWSRCFLRSAHRGLWIRCLFPGRGALVSWTWFAMYWRIREGCRRRSVMWVVASVVWLRRYRLVGLIHTGSRGLCPLCSHLRPLGSYHGAHRRARARLWCTRLGSSVCRGFLGVAMVCSFQLPLRRSIQIGKNGRGNLREKSLKTPKC